MESFTRYPFISQYGEKPLDRYLVDAGDLFRQYLRYMMETQWLLSILVPHRSYRVVAGLDLLKEGNKDYSGRQNPEDLAKEISTEWEEAFKASPEKRDRGDKVSLEAIRSSIDTIRDLLGWIPYPEVERPPVQPENNEKLQFPALHVIGYSLGGFFAQSVFFSWPFAISSCTTLCSGGPLRDVAPTAFAYPQEWDTVMHALRYEIESGMIEDRIPRPELYRIAGIKLDYFSYFVGIFYEIFLQDFRSSYRARLSEYASRLLFIIGGNDPVVRPQSVLDASPPGGINLMEIANLSHFLGTEKEKEWQEFWQPEVARVVGSFSERTEVILARTLCRNWWDKDPAEGVLTPRKDILEAAPEGQTSTGKGSKYDNDVTLANPEFDLELDAIVEKLEQEECWLFISRNEVPAALLGSRRLNRRGTILHYALDPIAEHLIRLERRGKILLDNSQRVTMVIPRQEKEWFTRETPPLSVKGQTVGGHLPSQEDLDEIWSDFYNKWKQKPGALRLFDAKRELRNNELEENVLSMLKIRDSKWIINTLPDVWVALSTTARSELRQYLPTMKDTETSRELRSSVELMFMRWATLLARGDEHSKQLLKKWLTKELRIIKISRAEVNPGFRGLLIQNSDTARRFVIHCAIGYGRSSPVL